MDKKKNLKSSRKMDGENIESPQDSTLSEENDHKVPFYGDNPGDAEPKPCIHGSGGGGNE